VLCGLESAATPFKASCACQECQEKASVNVKMTSYLSLCFTLPWLHTHGSRLPKREKLVTGLYIIYQLTEVYGLADLVEVIQEDYTSFKFIVIWCSAIQLIPIEHMCSLGP
jgi:hypothetical protein